MLLDVSLTPPANSPAAFLGWGVALALVVILVLWRRGERDRGATIEILKETVTVLKVDKADLEAKFEASEARADALAERYALEVKANAKTHQKAFAALTLIAASPPIKMPAHRELRDEDYEDTTGVSAAITAKTRADIDRLLSEFNPNDTDPPRPLPPRPRQKSRPDR